MEVPVSPDRYKLVSKIQGECRQFLTTPKVSYLHVENVPPCGGIFLNPQTGQSGSAGIEADGRPALIMQATPPFTPLSGKLLSARDPLRKMPCVRGAGIGQFVHLRRHPAMP